MGGFVAMGTWTRGWLLAAMMLASLSCGDDESVDASGATSSGSGAATSSGSASSSTSNGSGGASASSSAGSGGASSSTSGGGGASAGSGGSTPSGTVTVSMQSCGANDCDFTFNATKFGMHDGKTLYVNLRLQGQTKGVEFADSATISGGAASVTGTGVVTKGSSYDVNYFVDVDGNADCEIGGQDEIWRESITGVTGHVVVDAEYTVDFSNLGCSGHP